MISLVRSLHAWCGVFVCLFLVVIGLSGAISVLRAEVVRATTPAARAPSPPSATFGPALERYEASGGAPIRAVKFAPYGSGVHRALLDDGSAAFLSAEGQVVQHWVGRTRFEDWALSLHHELLAGAVGGRFVGLVGLTGVGMVVTGLLIWVWPRPRPGMRIWPRSAARRDALQAHWALGVVLSAFLVVQLTTGALMALGEFRPMFGAERPPPPSVSPSAGLARWSKLLAAAQAAYPDGRIVRVFAPPAPDAPFTVFLQRRTDLNPEGGTVVYVDGRGSVVGSYDIARQGLGARLYNALLGVHSGAYGGDGARIVTGLLGLGLATLSLYGAWAFIRGPRMRRRAPRAK